jgi:hypothetical protein
MDGEHEMADRLRKHVASWDRDEECTDDMEDYDPREDADSEDYVPSQAGRREGPFKRDFHNTATDSKGKASMESRLSRKVGHYANRLLEGRSPVRADKVSRYVRRLLG